MRDYHWIYEICRNTAKAQVVALCDVMSTQNILTYHIYPDVPKLP